MLRLLRITLPLLFSLALLLAQSALAGPFIPFSVPSGGSDLIKELGFLSYDAQWTKPGGGSSAIKQRGAYLQAGYEFVPEWQAFLRIGAVSIDGVELAFADGTVASTGSEVSPFGGIGVKGKVYLGNTFDLYAFADASYFGDSSTDHKVMISAMIHPPVIDQVPAQETLSLEKQIEANAGVLLAIGGERFALYAGPVAYWRTAQAARELKLDGDTFTSSSGKLRERGVVGGVAGVRIPLSKSSDLVLEAQQKSGFSVTTALAYLQFDL